MFFGSISSKNAVSYLTGIALNLISLGSIVILMILILPIQEHGMSFRVFPSSSISFISVMQFLEYRSFDSLGSFIPRYYILFVIVYFLFHC